MLAEKLPLVADRKIGPLESKPISDTSSLVDAEMVMRLMGNGFQIIQLGWAINR